MGRSIALVTRAVRAYDEALAFTKNRGLASRGQPKHAPGDGKRWVVVAPPQGRGAALLLARAATPERAAHVGDPTGGRVIVFYDLCGNNGTWCSPGTPDCTIVEVASQDRGCGCLLVSASTP